MSGPIFFVRSSCIITTISELLALDESIENARIDIELLSSATVMCIHVSLVFVLCYSAEQLTAQLNRIAESVYIDVNWFNLPIPQQKALKMIICRARLTFRLTGYDIFICSIESFLKVLF